MTRFPFPDIVGRLTTLVTRPLHLDVTSISFTTSSCWKRHGLLGESSHPMRYPRCLLPQDSTVHTNRLEAARSGRVQADLSENRNPNT